MLKRYRCEKRIVWYEVWAEWDGDVEWEADLQKPDEYVVLIDKVEADEDGELLG
jgi:hypothetical protein